MKTIGLLIGILWAFGAHSQSLPYSFEALVTKVYDGDSYKVLYNGKIIDLRLAHIDCPEKNQPYGNAATNFGVKRVANKKVKVLNQNTRDRNNRLIAVIIYSGVNLNEELVRNGLAWHFVRYSSSPSYAALEAKARENKVGLWAEPNAVPPWNWRKTKKSIH